MKQGCVRLREKNNMYELISELFLNIVMLFLVLSSADIRYLVFVGFVFLGVVIRHGREEE